MTSSFQIVILILSREVGYLFWVWMNSEKSRKQQLCFEFVKAPQKQPSEVFFKKRCS